jgi:ubiquitin fusion degradation protein 1
LAVEEVVANHKEVARWVDHQELNFSCVHSKLIHLHSLENKILIREIKVKTKNLSNPIVVILPGSALHELARLNITYPMLFMISNP